MYLVRGIPGSGKSTLANSLSVPVYEVDQYFINSKGEYHYVCTDLSQAHAWCYGKVKQSLTNGLSCAVANTFICVWQMEPYFALCERFGIELKIYECKGKYKNIHAVPEDYIRKMEKAWEQVPDKYQACIVK